MRNYNEKLKSIIKPILNKLNNERKNYLEEELNNIINHNQSLRILISYDISKYLKRYNYSYTFRGNITSSYLCYELWIHNVDCFNLGIIPEQCHGFDYNLNYSICFNVGNKVLNKILKHIDKIYSNKLIRMYSIFESGTISLNQSHRLYIIDDSIKYDTKIIYKDGIGYKCLKAQDISNDNNIIRIIPCGNDHNDLIDDIIKLIKKNNINIPNDLIRKIDNKQKYINELCNMNKDNIYKAYTFYFKEDYINEMIKKLKPKTYNDLIKICSLNYNINLYNNNQDIINIISNRDDVYDYLINNGFNKEDSFKISELIRKGKFKNISNSLKNKLSLDFINICNKIDYLFPRGHIVEYLNQDIFIIYLLNNFKYKIRDNKIKELRNNKINKEEYLNRLEMKYYKNGIEKCFKDQYLKGEGKELDNKFFSPISSSRLCFELFSWMSNDENIKDIEFEYYLPGLKSIHGYVVPQPNMDVYYVDDNINFVESKFTELSLNKKESISKNYYDYYVDGGNNVGEFLCDIANIRFDGNLIFAKYFIKLINDILLYGEENNLLNKIDWFDLKQEITHIFGIGQYIYKYRPTKNIKFINLIYLFDEGISILALKFKSLVVNMMNKYINDLNLNILFFYDFEFMQEYIKKINLNVKAFASNKTIKEILKSYKLEVL